MNDKEFVKLKIDWMINNNRLDLHRRIFKTEQRV